MPASITTKPQYAVPGRRTSVIITPADGSTNFVRVWCTAAPAGTAIRKQIDDARLARALLYDGPPGELHPWRTTFERGGVYTVVLQEYRKGNDWGGGYFGDPRGAPSETQLGAEQTLFLVVAERMLHELGFGSDTATLVIYMYSTAVIATTVAVNGEDSPAIIDPSSARALKASGNSDVLAEIAGFVDQSILANPAATFVALCQKFDAHLTASGKHTNDDTDNAITPEVYGGLGFSTNSDTLVQAMDVAAQKLRAHFLNDNGDGPGSGNYHIVSAEERGDWRNLPYVSSGGPDGAIRMLGDLVRALAAHVMDTNVHLATDATNEPTALDVVELHRLFLEALSLSSAAEGQSAGAAGASTWGFRSG